MLVTTDSLKPARAAKDVQSMGAGNLGKGSRWNQLLMAETT